MEQVEMKTFVNYVQAINQKLTFVICVINVFVWNVSMVNIGDMSVMRMIYRITISAMRGAVRGGRRNVLFHAMLAAQHSYQEIKKIGETF
jgi:hypothetical protein